jgi:hypothetical protein
MNFEKQNETRIFCFGGKHEITFWKTTNKQKMKKKLRKKQERKKG